MGTAGLTKHDRPSGIAETNDRMPTVKGMNYCEWHTNGVPPWAQGQAWFVPGCPTCKAKLDAGRVAPDSPPPSGLIRCRNFGRWKNKARVEKQKEAQRKFSAAQPAPGMAA